MALARKISEEKSVTENLVADDSVQRAWTWSLLGAMLTRPPEQEVVDALTAIADQSDSNAPLAPSWQALRAAALRVDDPDDDTCSLASLNDEYHDLFVGVGRGELLPYGSWYVTGFLMDKPLAKLRTDLDALGFERADDVKEPEDHAGALCEIMAMIISTDDISAKAEHTFFMRHLEPWMARFFHDVAAAKKADFYRPVGQFGAQFVELEKELHSI